MGSAHAIGECPIQLPGVTHDDQAGPVGVLGLELRHAEELNVDVLALERDDWVREHLVVGLGEAEGAVELEDLVDVAARKERNHDLVCQGVTPLVWSGSLISRIVSLPDRSGGLAEPLEAVEDDVERELELEVGVAAAEAAVVGGAQRHLGDVRKHRPQLRSHGLGHLRIGVGESSKSSRVNPSRRLPSMWMAWCVRSSEKPPPRRIPITVSYWRSIDGPGATRVSMTPVVHGWRRSTPRAPRMALRNAGFQSPPESAAGSWLMTTSTMPSSRSSLLFTWV